MSESNPLRLAVIIGSTRTGRFGPTVAAWFTASARRRPDLDVDVIDLAQARLPETLTDHEEPVPPQVSALAPRLADPAAARSPRRPSALGPPGFVGSADPDEQLVQEGFTANLKLVETKSLSTGIVILSYTRP